MEWPTVRPEPEQGEPCIPRGQSRQDGAQRSSLLMVIIAMEEIGEEEWIGRNFL